MEREDQPLLFNGFPPVSTAEWEEKIIADLKGADYAKKLIWKTEEGFDVKPYYRSEDLDGLDNMQTLPDSLPYLRGVRSMGNDWSVRQDFDTTDVTQANARALNTIACGGDAVGFNVTEITTHRQMSELLNGIDLKKTAVHFTTSRSYPLSIELLIYEVSHRAEGGELVRGSVNFDPISYLLLHGDFYVNWAHNLEETEYLLNTLSKRLPKFKLITVNGHYFQDSGSTLVQELAYSLASANEYLAGLTGKGFSVDMVAPFIQFSLATGPAYFLEIAKLRAARLLWTQMIGQYNPKNRDSYRLFIHARTARWNKTLYDPYVNMLRTTTEGMSAALGNADSLTIEPFDISFRKPGGFSERIARNQQLILKEESYLDKIADPAAGSYYIEKLTHSMAHHAWDLFREIESSGGMIECIKKGYIQEEITKSRQRKEADFAQRKLVLLGTNQYPNTLEKMRPMIDASGEKEESKPAAYLKIQPFRAGAAFEAIRLATEQHEEQEHRKLSVFLFTMGNLAMLRARAGFTANFFGCAGYEIIDNPGFASVDDGVESAHASGAPVVVICSSDEEYLTIVPEIAQKLKKKTPSVLLMVAGYPKEMIDTYKAAGVDDFIHVRSNLLETLQRINKILHIQ
jgi:methylmalonyl-CoA mutase